jgi:hypothetical protein
VVLRDLPYREPDRIVVLSTRNILQICRTHVWRRQGAQSESIPFPRFVTSNVMPPASDGETSRDVALFLPFAYRGLTAAFLSD